MIDAEARLRAALRRETAAYPVDYRLSGRAARRAQLNKIWISGLRAATLLALTIAVAVAIPGLPSILQRGLQDTESAPRNPQALLIASGLFGGRTWTLQTMTRGSEFCVSLSYEQIDSGTRISTSCVSRGLLDGRPLELNDDAGPTLSTTRINDGTAAVFGMMGDGMEAIGLNSKSSTTNAQIFETDSPELDIKAYIAFIDPDFHGSITGYDEYGRAMKQEPFRLRNSHLVLRR